MAIPMAHRVVREWARDSLYNYYCRWCSKLIVSDHYHTVYTGTPGAECCTDCCDKCVGGLDAVYNYYLEARSGQYMTIYYDIETVKHRCSNQVPKLAKI